MNISIGQVYTYTNEGSDIRVFAIDLDPEEFKATRIATKNLDTGVVISHSLADFSKQISKGVLRLTDAV